MYLVVTNKRDLTSDYIILELQRRGLSYLRLNTEDAPKGLLQWSPSKQSSIYYDVCGSSFSSADVSAAYFRRPGTPEPLAEIKGPEKTYCALEWQAILQSLYWSISDRWLNPPHQIFLAENKIYQLTLAQELGFLIPETLVSNDPIAVKDFLKGQPSIAKPLKNAVIKGNAQDRVIFTSRTSIDECEEEIAIKASPIIFQREIKKLYDVRVTVVGDHVFAATIDSQCNAATEVDWRKTSNPNLKHQAYELPHDVAAKCIALTKRLGLRFGAIDLVLSPDGQLWFLEINPNGQWGWIEMRTGHPIAAAIVSEMERIANE